MATRGREKYGVKDVSAQTVRVHQLHIKDLTELDDLTEMSKEEIIADCPPRDDLEDIMEWMFGDDIGDNEDED